MARGSKSSAKVTCVLPMIFAACLASFLLYQWVMWNQRHKREGFKGPPRATTSRYALKDHTHRAYALKGHTHSPHTHKKKDT